MRELQNIANRNHERLDTLLRQSTMTLDSPRQACLRLLSSRHDLARSLATAAQALAAEESIRRRPAAVQALLDASSSWWGLRDRQRRRLQRLGMTAVDGPTDIRLWQHYFEPGRFVQPSVVLGGLCAAAGFKWHRVERALAARPGAPELPDGSSEDASTLLAPAVARLALGPRERFDATTGALAASLLHLRVAAWVLGQPDLLQLRTAVPGGVHLAAGERLV